MWKISYLDLKSDKICLKGGFNNDKEAIIWAEKQEKNKNIIGLKILTWSEYIQNYKEVWDLTK